MRVGNSLSEKESQYLREVVSFTFLEAGPVGVTVRHTINFMVTPCVNNIHHFNFQLTHTTLKNVELLKHFKVSKTAPTCFGLQGNHHQGATVST